MKTIETDRLIIRNFDVEDWRDLQEMIIKYKETEYAKYDHEWPTSDAEIKNIVEWFRSGNSYLAVCMKTMNKLIGFIAIDRREELEGQVHNFGFIFHPQYHGQGYAAESCQAAIKYVFEDLAADGILTGTHPTNKPSVRLLNNLGMKEVTPGEFSISRGYWLTKE